MFNLHKCTNINPKETKYWYILVMVCENLTEKSIKNWLQWQQLSQ